MEEDIQNLYDVYGTKHPNLPQDQLLIACQQVVRDNPGMGYLGHTQVLDEYVKLIKNGIRLG